MSDAVYASGRQKFLEGSIHWLTDDIKAVLVDSALYTLDLSSHDFLDDIPVGAIIATSGNFTNKSSTGGVADADDISFSSATGSQCEYIIIYKDTGVTSTSPLIACIDSATGLPITPTGGDINVVWDNGSNKIFKL